MTNLGEAKIETEDSVGCLKTAAFALREEADRDGNVLLRPKLLGLAQKCDTIAKDAEGVLNEMKGIDP